MAETIRCAGMGIELVLMNDHKLNLSPRSHLEGDHLVIHLQIDEQKITFDAAPVGSGWSEAIIEYLFDAIH